MLSPVRRAPASIEKPPEPVRGQASRLPWAWDSLCLGIPFDVATRDSARDLVTNHAPSVVSGLAWARDYTGNVAANLNATAYIDYPDDPAQRKPSTALTAYVRFRRAGTANVSGGLFTRRYAASDPWVSWCIQHADAGDNTLAGNITVDGTSYYWEAFDYTTTTTDWVSVFLRWRTGSPPVLDILSERGKTLSTNFYASNLSGTISYVTGEPVRLNAVQDPAINFNADYSQAMLWSRRLTDRELIALVSDPYGWYSPRRETLIVAGPYPFIPAGGEVRVVAMGRG